MSKQFNANLGLVLSPAAWHFILLTLSLIPPSPQAGPWKVLEVQVDLGSMCLSAWWSFAGHRTLDHVTEASCRWSWLPMFIS